MPDSDLGSFQILALESDDSVKRCGNFRWCYTTDEVEVRGAEPAGPRELEHEVETNGLLFEGGNGSVFLGSSQRVFGASFLAYRPKAGQFQALQAVVSGKLGCGTDRLDASQCGIKLADMTPRTPAQHRCHRHAEIRKQAEVSEDATVYDIAPMSPGAKQVWRISSATTTAVGWTLKIRQTPSASAKSLAFLPSYPARCQAPNG
ncbi:hypothetical protein V8F33_001132 [Rhypophila sp. PSN 637]